MTETAGSGAPHGGAEAGVDLLVVGGGINGCGIARDAAGRGLAVLLCEQDDLAAHTSAASTKLIHGGLRYLELGHFGLVRKALRERELLLASAPHIMRPLRFVLPHAPHLRPAWMIRAGLLLYDHLARRRRLPRSAEIDLRTHPAGAALRAHACRAFVYSDVWADDSRLVVLNALDAAERGARVLTRMRCTRLHPDARGGWIAELAARPEGGGASRVRAAATPLRVRARAVVNAAGPWVARFLESATPVRARHAVRLVKGSHIVVRQLFAHRFAYIFQNEDRRIGFAIPWEREFTLIGTTDVDYPGDPAGVRISAEETAYLCEMARRWFARDITASDVVWSFAGVRPLLDDESSDLREVTRDWTLDLARQPAPLLTVYGGKLTTYRRLAEEAVNRLAPQLDCRAGPWTAHAHLPGGDLPAGSFAVLLRTLEKRHPWLPPPLRTRFAQAYGTRVDRVLGTARSLAGLGAAIAPQLYEREIEYLCREEWARTAHDILWRRSKLGLHLGPEVEEALERWLEGRALSERRSAPAGS